MSKNPFSHRFEAALSLGAAGYLRREDELFGNMLLNSQFAADQIGTHRNIQLITRPSLIMDRGTRGKFLKYVSLLFPILFTVDPFKLKLSTLDGFISAPIPYKTFEIFYKIDKDISAEKINKVKALLERTYSGDWAMALRRVVRWPRTDAPVGLEDLFPDGWRETGVLSALGYNVGVHGSADSARRSILSSIVEDDVIPDNLKGQYKSKWGESMSLTRLLKLARTIAVLCRNAKGSPNNLEKAILQWESDLNYLKYKYFHNFLNLNREPWPSTAVGGKSVRS